MTPIVMLHVERAFSAQPTLGDLLGPDVSVHELPLAEALAGDLAPHLVWVSTATVDAVHLLRLRFPDATLLATVRREAVAPAVVSLFAAGADLVLRDEGVLLAAAALESLARRRPHADPALTLP